MDHSAQQEKIQKDVVEVDGVVWKEKLIIFNSDLIEMQLVQTNNLKPIDSIISIML